MKKILAIVFFIITSFSAFAGGTWEDVIKAANDGTLTEGTWVDGSLYYADFRFNVTNLDGTSGNFAGSDTARIIVTGNGRTLDTGTSLTKDQLTSWAKANAAELYDIVFGSDPSAALSGLPGNTVDVMSESEKIMTIDMGYFNGYESEIKLSSEKSYITSNGIKSQATSGILNLQKLNNNFKRGLMIPYRYVNSDDNTDAKSYSLSLVPFLTYYQDFTDKFTLAYTGSLNGKVQYMESELFPDGGGYFEYGYGAAVSPGYMLTKKILLRGVVGYNYRKKEIPSDMISDDMQWVADALEETSEQKLLNTGVGLVLIPVEKMSIAFEASKIKHLIEENVPDGKESATYYTAQMSYKFSALELTVGYKTVQDVDDYSEHAYRANVSFRF